MWRMARYLTLVVGVIALTVLDAYTQAFIMIGVGIYTELWVNGQRPITRGPSLPATPTPEADHGNA